MIAELEIEEQFYVVVSPVEEEEHEHDEDCECGEEVEVLILKATYDDEGNMFLADIEDDEEWEKVADAWQELVDSEEIQ
ncbi:MAG: DUF1292 domain-containing protein [Candidatus Saccharibacteria bacterium]